MTAHTFDWSRFFVRISIKAPLEKLYHAWATRDGIESWFLRLSEFKSSTGEIRKADEPVEKADTYRWLWHGWGDDTEEKGTILDCNGKDYFKFSFGKAGICTVKLKKEQNENIVELVQEDIPTDEHGKQIFHLGCKSGWTFYLANLKSIFEGGIDLRNRNAKLQDVLNS